MAPRKQVAQKAPARAKSSPPAAKSNADQGKQPARKRTESAPTPVKLVRKGRQPTAGAKLTRELARKDDGFARSTLIAQAARLADRLEVIARFLSGDVDEWRAVKIAGQVAKVVVTDVVREERQQSEVLRKLIMDIEKLGGDDAGEKGGPKVDRLAEIVADHYGGRKRA